MRDFILILRRELNGFYRTSGAYILYIMFLVVTSLWIYRIDNFIVRNIADFTVYFSLFLYILAVVIPAMTMGGWAGEKGRGTYDLVLTQPLSTWTVAVGKYAAVMIETIVMILLTVPVPITLSVLGNFDFGQIAVEYAGIVLFSSTIIGIGLFVSSMCGKQMQAYIITLMLLVLMIFPIAVTGSIFDSSKVYNFVEYVSPAYHLEGFGKGVVDSRDMFFYLFSSALFVFLSYGRIEMEKWF